MKSELNLVINTALVAMVVIIAMAIVLAGCAPTKADDKIYNATLVMSIADGDHKDIIDVSTVDLECKRIVKENEDFYDCQNIDYKIKGK